MCFYPPVAAVSIVQRQSNPAVLMQWTIRLCTERDYCC